MALALNLTGDILHVRETQVTGRGTKTAHWYYNVQNWAVSSHGREGDIPDRPMTPSAIEWVQKHYLPKVEQEDLAAPRI